MSIGQNIKNLRIWRGWTQAELADKAHISVDGLRRVEELKCEPRWSTMKLLAEALDVPIATITGEADLTMKQYAKVALVAMQDMEKRLRMKDEMIAKLVLHGYWIPIADGEMAECSECGECCDSYDIYASASCFADFEKEYKFCPHCGAKMDGGKDAVTHGGINDGNGVKALPVLRGKGKAI